jgi:hypothetical protein
MNDSRPLPPEQEAIRTKRFQPTGRFVEFAEDEVEQSIPERYEKIVVRHPHRIAVKEKIVTFTYDALNKLANRKACSYWPQVVIRTLQAPSNCCLPVYERR